MTRDEARQWARNVLPRLNAGGAAVLEIAGQQPHNREAALAVNGVAHRLFGTGEYTICAERGRITVTRNRSLFYDQAALRWPRRRPEEGPDAAIVR